MTKLLQMIDERYLVHRLVGSGGFGTVYQAEDVVLQRLVALKEIEITDETATVPHRSPLHEARMLASHPHPHIPHVYDAFLCEDSEDSRVEKCYIVMEWVNGERLSDYRRMLGTPGRPPAFLECVRLSIQLCQAVRFLHEQQPSVILRDIKPENILVTRRGKLFLIDFGAFKYFEPGLLADIHHCGSWGYEAPEVITRTAQTSVVTDIYSLGVTLYELFFQRSLIFEDGNPCIEYAESPDLVQLLCHMAAKDPSRRPQTVREVQKELRRLEGFARAHPNLPLKDLKEFGSESLFVSHAF